MGVTSDYFCGLVGLVPVLAVAVQDDGAGPPWLRGEDGSSGVYCLSLVAGRAGSIDIAGHPACGNGSSCSSSETGRSIEGCGSPPSFSVVGEGLSALLTLAGRAGDAPAVGSYAGNPGGGLRSSGDSTSLSVTSLDSSWLGKR